MEIEELEIDAPWGSIAVKLWGDKSNPAILCVHGIMDNAGSMDGLIQLLPTSYYYICVDLPGHGLSSKFPLHIPTYSINNLLVYMIVTDFFAREKYILMGHSWGGQLGILFAQMYPQKVEKLIVLDSAQLMPVPSTNSLDLIANALDEFIKIEEKLKTGASPTYTYEQALEKFSVGRRLPLTKKAAEALLERTLIPLSENEFRLSFDQRLKSYINPLQDFKDILSLLKYSPVQCPMLIIRAKITFNIYKPVDKYLKTVKNFTYKLVDGTHDVHANEPEKVAPLIIVFLQKKKAKL